MKNKKTFLYLLILFLSPGIIYSQQHNSLNGNEYLNQKSIAVYIGRNLTVDGSVLLGGFGHEPSSHWIEIVPRQYHEEGAKWKVGVTEKATIPGKLIEIPQTSVTYKYITSFYSEFSGFPPPLTNGGLNEYGVAARDVWSPSRPELVKMSRMKSRETPQTGPNYSDLSKAAMERAQTARDAVLIVGELINKYGYSTYGGNSHLFADNNEGWVFINYAGGLGLWAAERLGPDDIRVSYPGYIGQFPVNHEEFDDYMASENLITFIKEQGWWDGKGDWINLREILGVPFPGENSGLNSNFYSRAQHPQHREAELMDKLPVSLEFLISYIRDPRWSTDLAGYGQVAHLRPDVHPELQTLWVAVTTSSVTPFIPIPVGAVDVPAEFKQHRYMTKGSYSRFMNPDYAALEATRYATRTFKRLLYHISEHPTQYLKPVTAEIESFERILFDERNSIERKAMTYFYAGEDARARDFLTEIVMQRMMKSLDLGEKLVSEVEKRIRNEHGIRMPFGYKATGETTPASSQRMDTKGMVHVYHPSLDEYPRGHGIYEIFRGLIE